MNYGLVTVETRPLPNIREIVENHIHFTGWPVTFFHGLGNGDYVKKELEGLNVSFRQIECRKLTMEEYNNLLTSVEFWKAIPYDKVLMFQHDSRLLRKGIEDFLGYDFIGAPIKHIRFPLMNGGLSLRTKIKCLEIIEKVPYDGQVNEDMYFCDNMEKVNGKLPSKEVAQIFSVETIFSFGSCGFHAIDSHLSKAQCEQIRTQYKLVYG